MQVYSPVLQLCCFAHNYCFQSPVQVYIVLRSTIFRHFSSRSCSHLRQQKLQYNTGPAPLSLLANLNVPAALHCKFLRKQWESTGCSSNTCPLPTGWMASANHCSCCWIMPQTAIEQWLAAQAGTMHLNGLFCPSEAQQQACKHTAKICKARTS